MKWMRQFVPSGMFPLGIALITVVGISIAAQDRDDPQSAPRKTPEAATPKVQRAATLGAQFQVKGDQGLSVTAITPNGVLGHAGLKTNDRIISADGLAFNNPRQLEAYLWGQSGRAVPIVVERGSEQHTIQANIPLHAPTSAWLGLFLDEGEANVAGARVTHVYPGGPAARAGIQVGDLIQRMNTTPIASSAEAVLLIRELQPKTEVIFTIERGQDDLKIPVTIGTRGNQGNQTAQAAPPQIPQPGQQPDQHAAPGGLQPDGTQQFNGIPPYAMQLENDRRMAEQHERIEEEVRLLRLEIQKLRELIEKK